MSAVIEFKNVHKEFNVYRGGAKDIKHHLIKPLHRKRFKQIVEHKVVLRDVSFEIRPGEFVGIMGRNGVGKSTILKMLAGIYLPNAGTINVHGQIAPVLELGAGFADELSGYENIALNASILGYGRKQISEDVEKIIEFSELGDQIYDPVRNYSSGMLVRLAFAIACHLSADILLFDEVLAVGDIGFQNKCIRKIKELHQKGRSIVLVTHNPAQVSEFCDRCIVLDKGHVIFDGSPVSGSDVYSRLFS